jgi:hypothetical protein
VGIKRIVDTSFWTDGKVDEFSPEDKYFMLYLLTSPFSTQLGIYEISIKQVAFQLGYSMDAVKVLLDRFENKYGMIIYSPSTNEIAIKNFLCHSIVKGGKPVEDCIEREMRLVKNRELLKTVFEHISQKSGLNQTVTKIINQYFTENENDNDNDNDNDVSLPVRGTIRSEQSSYESIKEQILTKKGNGEKICAWCGCKTTVLHKHHYPIPKRLGGKETVDICPNCHDEFHVMEIQIYGDNHSDVAKPPQKPKAKKHKYGEYSNVLLTDEELEKLKTEFPDWKERIERLSSYVASKGAKYKSHYATIRSWARKEGVTNGQNARDSSKARIGNYI